MPALDRNLIKSLIFLEDGTTTCIDRSFTPARCFIFSCRQRLAAAAEYIWGTFYYRNNITRSLLAHGLNKISLLAILYSKAGARVVE